MDVELRALSAADAPAHNAGEDEETVRWLTGGRSTIESTVAHFEMLAANLERGEGQRGFGVWVDGPLAGYVDCNPEVTDGVRAGEVNITYAVHPWARGRGVATQAVNLICAFIRDHRIGTTAAIRVDPANETSIRLAERCGFRFKQAFTSATDIQPDGAPAVLRLYLRDLNQAS